MKKYLLGTKPDDIKSIISYEVICTKLPLPQNRTGAWIDIDKILQEVYKSSGYRISYYNEIGSVQATSSLEILTDDYNTRVYLIEIK